MTVSIQISPETEAQLTAHARLLGISLEVYLQRMLEHEAKANAATGRPLRSSYGALAKHGPAPSIEEINANRTEMFRNFAKGDEEQ